ncbi:ABC transporter permease [Ensifer sp. HO-A22]|uniref:ABC transporter permease n=1 Tax=Ensifer oleiphilus TaxID=2742698 RepID=A0A7Y6Q815_9HYPH|nr:ABC transporter permease [Ensifer oleiphilus]NVD40744.1 ABC transporter permease [Ensifer oleiphilus]
MIGFILADLRRLWAGSLVVVLLVALATALGVAVTLQERALRLGSARAADKFDLVIGAPGSETQLVLSSIFLQPSPLPLMAGTVLPRLLADPRVASAAPVGFGDSFGGYAVVGTSTGMVRELEQLSEGRVFTVLGEAVVGSAVDLPLGYAVKPTHGLAELGGHAHTELAYRIVGRLKPTGTAWDRAILVPMQAVWALHGMEVEHDEAEARHDHAHDEAASGGEAGPKHIDADAALNEDWSKVTPGLPAILVRPKSIADAYKLRQDYRDSTTLAVFPGEVLTNLYATLGDAKRVLVGVTTGAQVLVAAAILLVTILHVGQRRRQIGALRAFGAPRRAVFIIVWSELFALIASGVLVGFGLGFAAAKFIAGYLSGESGVAMPVTVAAGDGLLVSILLTFAAGLAVLPAMLAYMQSPAAALRA